MLLEYRFLLPAIAVVVLGFTGPSRAQLMTRGAQSSTSEINVTADKLSTGDGANQIDAAGNVEIKRGDTTIKGEEVRVNRTDSGHGGERQSVPRRSGMEDQVGGRYRIQPGKGNRGDSKRRPFPRGRAHQYDRASVAKVWRPNLSCRRRLFYDLSMRERLAVVEVFRRTDGSRARRRRHDQARLFLRHGLAGILSALWCFSAQDRKANRLSFPQFGHSTKEGFRFIQPFFWAMSKSTDSTVKFDIETAARVGFITEFRTLFDRESYFRMDNAYFNETWRTDRSVVDNTIANPTIPINRGSIVGSHRYTTSTDWLTFSDIAVYSDDLYTRELIERFDLPIQQDSDIRQSRFGASRIGVFRNWGDTFFKGEMNFFQDFIQPESGTLQRTPNIGLWGRRFLSDFPLEFRWRADGVSYIRQSRRRRAAHGFKARGRVALFVGFASFRRAERRAARNCLPSVYSC